MHPTLNVLLCATAALSLSVASCGHGEEGCPELCERTAECPGATQTKEQCRALCDAEKEVVEKAECEDQWDEFIECRNHSNDACNAATFEEECSVQFGSYGACLSAYCGKSPGECEGIAR